MTTDIETLVSEAIGLLKSLIAIPSLSREEEQAADFLQNYLVPRYKRINQKKLSS